MTSMIKGVVINAEKVTLSPISLALSGQTKSVRKDADGSRITGVDTKNHIKPRLQD